MVPPADNPPPPPVSGEVVGSAENELDEVRAPSGGGIGFPVRVVGSAVDVSMTVTSDWEDVVLGDVVGALDVSGSSLVEGGVEEGVLDEGGGREGEGGGELGVGVG
jgi:hypothetical protein